MRIAVIDMGTNTFHLILVEIQGDRFHIFYKEKIAVKIGEKGINKGFITPEAILRALTALKTFKLEIDQRNISHVFATATSAVRNARNGEQLVELIEKETQIKTKIISGIEEADLIYLGVSKALDIGNEPALILDIGGGSIEFIIGTHQKILWRQSFELGGQRLVEKFHHSDPISKDELRQLLIDLDKNLNELIDAASLYKPTVLIGSSGTFDTLSEIYTNKNGIFVAETDTEYPLTLEAFENIYHDLITKTRQERLNIPGMIELRVDMIVVAVALINYVIEKLQIKSIRVSAYALKEGVLLQAIQNQMLFISEKPKI